MNSLRQQHSCFSSPIVRRETENRGKNGNIFIQQNCFEKDLCEHPPCGLLSADMKGDQISVQGIVQFHET